VGPTRDIMKKTNIVYSWHDLVSKNNHNDDEEDLKDKPMKLFMY